MEAIWSLCDLVLSLRLILHLYFRELYYYFKYLVGTMNCNKLVTHMRKGGVFELMLC